MAQRCFPFNEFGPLVLKGTSAFLQNSTCVHGRSAPRHRCFPDGAIPGGLQGLSPVSKRPRMADSTPNDRRIAAAERLEVKHQRLASSCWPLTALRLLWNPLDQHGLTAVTLLGYEPITITHHRTQPLDGFLSGRKGALQRSACRTTHAVDGREPFSYVSSIRQKSRSSG
jgi:hypothetical protein